MDQIDEVMEPLLSRPEPEWEAGLEQLCRGRPEFAGEMRRRFAVLRESGLLPEAPAGRPVPERLGEFTLVRVLGEGGMGIVYEARQERLHRNVALKLVRPGHLFFPGAKERFHREIEAVARLSHSGIVSVFTVGEEQDVPYFAMELLRGASLDDVQRELAGRDVETLTGTDLAGVVARRGGVATALRDGVFIGSWPSVVLEIGLRLAQGLAHAHEHGVVHRDVKPSNVMVTPEGRVVLLDFGLATANQVDRLTRTGIELGSVPYLAPEVVKGSDADARSDQYALGLLLYELLAGWHPFLQSTSEATRVRVTAGGAPSLRARNRAVPRDLAVVLAKAMEPAPVRRYASVAEFAADLDRVRRRLPIAARPAGSGRRLLRWSQRHPALATGLTLGLLLVAGTPTVVAFSIAGQRDRARAAELEAERNAYEANIAAANTALQAGEDAEVRRRLEACPQALRGFEWRHLQLALDGSLRRFEGHQHRVTAVAITDDAQRMASGDQSGLLLLWEPLLSTAGMSVALPGASQIDQLAFGNDGRHLIVVHADQSVQVVDVQTRNITAERPKTAPGERLCLTTGSDKLLLARSDFTVEELDARTLQSRRMVRLDPVGGAPSGPLVSCGTWLFMPWFADLHAWRLQDGRVEVLHDACVSGVQAAAATGGTAMFTTQDGRLLLAETAPLRVRTLTRTGLNLDHLALDRGGTFLAGVGADSALRTWHARSGQLLSIAHGSPAVGRAVAIASRRLLVAVGGDSGALQLFGMYGGRDRQVLLGHSGIVTSLELTPGGLLLSGSEEPALRAWDPDSGMPRLASYVCPHHVTAVVTAQDGQHVYAMYHGSMVRLRLPGLEYVDALEVGLGYVYWLLPLPDGRIVAVAYDNAIKVIDYASRTVVQRLEVPGGGARSACLSNEGRLFTGADGNIVAWRVGATLAPEPSIPAAGLVTSLLCNRAGTMLLASEGRTLRARALQGGRVLWERQCPHPAWSLWLLPDESRLVSGHQDGTVCLWDTSDGRCMIVLQTGTHPIRSLIGDPRGRWIAAASDMARVTVFRTDTSDSSFTERLAQADTDAAMNVDDELSRELMLMPEVLAAIEARTELDEGLRKIMAQVERLRPPLSWEAMSAMLRISSVERQPAARYELALRVAEFALARDPLHDYACATAALANLRLLRPAAALRHSNHGLNDLGGKEWSVRNRLRAARAMALQALGQPVQAQAELASLEQAIAGAAVPDLDDLRLLHEARRVLAQ